MDEKRSSLPILGPESDDTALDLVCGMTVKKPAAKHTLDYDGTRYYFCSRSCKEKFAAAPSAYLNNPSRTHAGSAPRMAAHAVASPESIYICPLHPEVRQTGPGSCPKCGMALEPESPLPLAERVEYTCPMHPEILQDKPGNCPKCGMALARPELLDTSTTESSLLHMVELNSTWKTSSLVINSVGSSIAPVRNRSVSL